MLVVGVEEESVVDVAWVGRGVPEKPMTALISKSFCINDFTTKSYTFVSNCRTGAVRRTE